MKNYPVFLLASLFLSFSFVSCEQAKTDLSSEAIRIYDENPFYWEYKGEPVLLVGGSYEDNLFNYPEGLEQHLNNLKASGGNYIRNTMSSRDPGNQWAFKKLENGLYDLEQWNKEYWDRFENLLKLAFEWDIIVQIEIWDPWDFFRSEAALGFGDGNVGWESCPFNPSLNINYTSEETGLENKINYTLHTPGKHLFFQTIPAFKNINKVLKYQEAYVAKILDISLNYPNVLYNIRNECREHEEWSKYWAAFIRENAAKKDKQIYIKSMRMFSDEFNVFESQPANHLLSDRDPNEAYCMAVSGNQYVVYFTNDGEVSLDLSGAEGELSLTWLNIADNRWLDGPPLNGGNTISLKTPGGRQWVALIKSES
jgi:hypothetical protein